VVVMPAAMASVLLMPLGLEVLPLKLMAAGLWLVMTISDWVASWPGAGVRLPRLGTVEAALLSMALALLLLPRTHLRLTAVPVFLLATAAFLVPKPGLFLLVDERAGNVAVQTPEGLVPALPRRAAGSVSRWLAQAGDDASFKEAAARAAWICSPQSCVSAAASLKVAFLLKTTSPFLKCPEADVIVSQEPLRRRCKGKRLTIDRFDVWRNGAHAVFADGSAEHVRGLQGQRPWVYEPRARERK
jgi:competence protein ComEC